MSCTVYLIIFSIYDFLRRSRKKNKYRWFKVVGFGGGGGSGETLLCAAPPLIAICRPYMEPARFARQNFSVEIPFYLAQISNRNDQYRKRNSQGKCMFIVVLLEKDKIYFEINYFSATFQRQGNILNEKYTHVGSHQRILE